MGSRLLRRWLNRPIRDHAELKHRQQALDVLQRSGPVEALQGVLREIGDLERILTRIGLRSARPRDLANLRDSLALLPELRRLASPLAAERLKALASHCGEHAAEQALLKRALVETPPVLLRDGGVIAPGYDADLDELRRISTNADQYLEDLEARERARTGIANLKVGYNRVHGFYIELTRGQAASAPADYIRRQTLKGAERYVTPELKDFEDKVLSARERSLSREKQLYDELLDLLARDLAGLQRTAEAIAELDTLIDLAERARTLNLVLPKLVDGAAARVSRRPPPRRRAIERRAVRAERPQLERARAHADHHGPEHGRQVDVHAPDGADRDPRAHRQRRARRVRDDRPDRPHLHAHRRRRRPHGRPLDVHGRDDGDGKYFE